MKVVRWKFRDGSIMTMPLSAMRARLKRQRAAWARIRANVKRENGRKGGRPRGAAPDEGEMLLRFSELWLNQWRRPGAGLAARARARARLVKELAGEQGKDERHVRRWLDRAVGATPRRQIRRK